MYHVSWGPAGGSSRRLTCAAKSARLPPVGAMHLGICRLWYIKVSEPRLGVEPSFCTLAIEPEAGVEGLVGNRETDVACVTEDSELLLGSEG